MFHDLELNLKSLFRVSTSSGAYWTAYHARFSFHLASRWKGKKSFDRWQRRVTERHKTLLRLFLSSSSMLRWIHTREGRGVERKVDKILKRCVMKLARLHNSIFYSNGSWALRISMIDFYWIFETTRGFDAISGFSLCLTPPPARSFFTPSSALLSTSGMMFSFRRSSRCQRIHSVVFTNESTSKWKEESFIDFALARFHKEAAKLRKLERNYCWCAFLCLRPI